MTKTPAAHLLGQGPRAYRVDVRRIVVYGLLWAWVLAVVVLVSTGASRPRIERDRAVAEVIMGEGDMSTGTFRLERGLHRLVWSAPCVLDVEIWRNVDGRDVFVYPLGRHAARSVTLPVAATGRYFLSVGSGCAWSIAVR